MPKVTDNIFILVLLTMAGTFLLAASFIYFYVRYQRRMLSQKEAMQKAELEHRENLLHAAIQSQEEERKRIGRDLHDDVGSALSNLRMVMGEIVQVNEEVSGSEAAQTYKPLIDNIINNVRSISHSLSPPGLDLFGLEHTLHELCDTVNGTGKMRLDLENNTGGLIDEMGRENSLAIYRVMQELLNNTIKHAQATAAVMTFNRSDKGFSIEYKDNGRGIDLTENKKPGMGLQNIEGRLGMINAGFEIISSPGNGFKIIISLPLN